MPIRIATMIEASEPLSLVTHFHEHYVRLGVSEFFVIIHDHEQESEKCQRMMAHCVDLGMQVDHVLTDSFTTKIKQAAIEEIKNLRGYSRDWWFNVDIDEFVEIDRTRVLEIVQSQHDFVVGFLADRFAPTGHFAHIESKRPISSVFSRLSLFSRDVLLAHINKVPLSRTYVRLLYGHHTVASKCDESWCSPDLLLAISHYKWSAGIIEKIQERIAKVLDVSEEQWRKEMSRFLAHIIKDGSMHRIQIENIQTWDSVEDVIADMINSAARARPL